MDDALELQLRKISFIWFFCIWKQAIIEVKFCRILHENVFEKLSWYTAIGKQ